MLCRKLKVKIHSIFTIRKFNDFTSTPDQVRFKLIKSFFWLNLHFYLSINLNNLGFILPGESLKLHVVFKSTSGGIFTESWEFITKPKLVGGASLVLTLRGVAIIEDKFKKSRISLEVCVKS